MVFPVEFHGVEYLVHVRCRPYLREFLEMVHEKFEVVIFTASQQVYADKLLDKIDPGEQLLFRDLCVAWIYSSNVMHFLHLFVHSFLTPLLFPKHIHDLSNDERG
jgi:TFIIF-interacting CTD phosphatase-like protein